MLGFESFGLIGRDGRRCEYRCGGEYFGEVIGYKAEDRVII